MDIAIIGASGTVGRLIAHMLVSERLLEPGQRLVLVGMAGRPSAASLYGIATDLTDAYYETGSHIDIVLEPEAMHADLVIMTAGATTTLGGHGGPVSRDAVAEINAPIFGRYAQALAQNGSGHEIVICVSNPNELAVATFARHLGRQRVVGMGAYLDSMRFRREIAAELGIRRQRVHGYVAGEHGQMLVPLWSSVHVYGMAREEWQRALAPVRGDHTIAGYHGQVDRLMAQIGPLVTTGRTVEAYDIVQAAPPDVRVALKPYVTHFSGSKTAYGTARATVEMVRTVLAGNDGVVAGQVVMDADRFGVETAMGYPIVIGNRGVERLLQIDVDPDEREALEAAARSIVRKLAPHLVKNDNIGEPPCR